MTPSEKKARECIDAGDKCPCIKADYPCEEHQMEAIVLALSEAERRGFERAKELAAKIGERYEIAFEVSSKIRSLTHDEA